MNEISLVLLSLSQVMQTSSSRLLQSAAAVHSDVTTTHGDVTVRGAGLRTVPVSRPAEFRITGPPGTAKHDLRVTIRGQWTRPQGHHQRSVVRAS